MDDLGGHRLVSTGEALSNAVHNAMVRRRTEFSTINSMHGRPRLNSGSPTPGARHSERCRHDQLIFYQKHLPLQALRPVDVEGVG